MRPLSELLLILLVLSQTEAAELDSLWIPGAVPGDSVFVLLMLPEGEAPSAQGMPVAYLLHGFGADPRAMLEITDIGAAADRYGMAIVCPDGRSDSWYFDSPVDSSYRMETIFIRHLIPLVESRYKLRRDQAGRGIVGLSMGGHGALYLALRNPGVFGAAASISGVLDLTETTQPEALSRRLGSFERFARRWRAMSVLALVDSLEPGRLELSIDCGIRDPFLAGNREVHQKLLLRRIDHVYTERPGGHDRGTFARALEHQLLFLGEFFGTAK